MRPLSAVRGRFLVSSELSELSYITVVVSQGATTSGADCKRATRIASSANPSYQPSLVICIPRSTRLTFSASTATLGNPTACDKVNSEPFGRVTSLIVLPETLNTLLQAATRYGKCEISVGGSMSALQMMTALILEDGPDFDSLISREGPDIVMRGAWQRRSSSFVTALIPMVISCSIEGGGKVGAIG